MTCLRRIAVLLTTALLAPAAAAGAAPSSQTLDIHPLFGASAAAGYSVGQPLFVGPRGKARLKRVCWTPAPVERPACSASSFGAPTRAGTQKLSVTFTNGTVVSVTLHVRPAPTRLPGFADAPAQALRVTCATRFFANSSGGRLRDEIQPPLAAGRHVAAYYRVSAHPHIVQAWAYGARTAGFVRDTCLKPLSSRTHI